MPTERHRVTYAGRVQGVGFRFISQRLAQSYAVTGYVMNRPDGQVELVAEGEPETIGAFLRAIETELGNKIHSATMTTEVPGGPPFSEFSIRHY